MEQLNRYNHFNQYLKNKFGERTLKICIDGNFTCPNRDGKCGIGGCIFCSETGSGEHLNSKTSIENQVRNHLNSYRGQRANKFIVYFQNFTNTYDTTENLKLKYDSALIDDRIVGISIATRPDCITEDIVKLIKSYSPKYHVWIELGLQTSNDNTAKIINRGYDSKCFSEAVKLLNKYNIDVVVHLMLGLPNETKLDVKNTIQFINNHKIHGIKIHSCYIVKNTILEKMYLNNKYLPISLEEYIELTTYILTHISDKIVIHRLSGDAPKDLLVAPYWNSHKKWILNGINKKLIQDNLWQGKFYTK